MKEEIKFWLGFWEEVTDSGKEIKPEGGFFFHVFRSGVWLSFFSVWMGAAVPYLILRKAKRVLTTQK
jgi:hypothetical protein